MCVVEAKSYIPQPCASFEHTDITFTAAYTAITFTVAYTDITFTVAYTGITFTAAYTDITFTVAVPRCQGKVVTVCGKAFE